MNKTVQTRVAGKLYRVRQDTPRTVSSCTGCAFCNRKISPIHCCGHPAYVFGYGCPAIHIFHNTSGGCYTLVDEPEDLDI